MSKYNKKIRLSHSLIQAWERGKPDEAVAMYLHMDTFTNQAMIDGRRIHEEIADHIDKFNSLPEYLGVKMDLNLPETEKELIVEYNELFDFKGIIDCLDIPIMFEWKTGVSDSLEWARTKQLPLYFMALDIAEIPVESAYLAHYNQHTKENDLTIVHNSPRLVEEGRNIIDSVGPEIWDFFKGQGLI